MTAICHYQPPAGSSMGGACQTCGHAIVVHVGVKQCPVCFLVAFGEAWQDAMRAYVANLRQQANAISDQAWPNT